MDGGIILYKLTSMSMLSDDPVKFKLSDEILTYPQEQSVKLKH